MSELANNKSIRKEVNDLGETLGITPNGKTNQQKIRSIGEQASDGTYATKEYVNTLMSGALKRQIVVTLPVTNIDTNTIYMVLDQSASQQGNVYNEYLYINNAWELIGTTATSGVETILLEQNTLLTETQYYDIVDKKLIAVTGEDKQVILSGWDDETGEYARLSSTIYDGKYTLVEFEENTDQSTSKEFPFKVHSIQEISVGGGIEFVELSYNSGQGGTITQAQATLLTNGAWVKMNDFASYSLPMLPSKHAPSDGLLHFATALETTGRGEIWFREIIVDTQNLTYTVESHQIQPYQA